MNGNNFVFDKVGAGVELSIGKTTTAVNGLYTYYIIATNVPEDIVRNALRECNGSEDGLAASESAAVSYAARKCVGNVSGMFAMAFDSTR